MVFGKLKEKISWRIRDMKYADTYSTAAAIFNQKAFEGLKGCNAGKKIALCGGGPSLNQYKVMDHVLHVALNRAILNENIRYDWMIADDWDGISHIQREIIEYDCLKFFGRHTGAPQMQIPESFVRKCGARVYYTDLFIVGNGYLSQFTLDIEALPVGNMPNIALSAMQILLYTQPDVIYLVGCDASIGHFNENKISTRKRQRINDSTRKYVRADKTIGKWKECKRFAEIFYPDTKIVSINPVGLKGLFEDQFQRGKI